MKFFQRARTRKSFYDYKPYVYFLLAMWALLLLLENTIFAVLMASSLKPLLTDDSIGASIISALALPALFFSLPLMLISIPLAFLLLPFGIRSDLALTMAVPSFYPFLWIFWLLPGFSNNTPPSFRWKAVIISAIVSILIITPFMGLMRTSRPDAQNAIGLFMIHGFAAMVAAGIMSGFIAWSKRFDKEIV